MDGKNTGVGKHITDMGQGFVLTLAELAVGQRARISGLDFEGSGLRRLIDLGFFGGAEVCCVGQSPMGDPRAYEVRGAVVAIRGRDAARISVRCCPTDRK